MAGIMPAEPTRMSQPLNGTFAGSVLQTSTAIVDGGELPTPTANAALPISGQPTLAIDGTSRPVPGQPTPVDATDAVVPRSRT